MLFFRKISFISTSSTTSSSTSSSSSKPVRSPYTLDNCGHDLSYSYSTTAAKKGKGHDATPFRRAAYTLDSQGHDFSSTYAYDSTTSSSSSSKNDNSDDDAGPSSHEFRSLYTMDWQPCSFAKKA